MVRVEMPRFFREGDESALKAVVHNETDSELSGSLALSVLRDSDTVASSFGLKDLERSFTVKPHSLEAFTWKVTAPRELGSYTVRAVARSGEKVDAEERDLPVLPSRQRLIDSLVVALNGDASKILSLRSLTEKDKSRQDELVQLQIDPQLALTVLNSLPFLVHYPHECVEQTLHRYVPLAIVNSLYRRHPAIAKAAAKIPKRLTLTPAWDKDDPKRLMRLMETPWLQHSEGVKSYWPVLDLFDTAVVTREEKDAMDRLKSSQLPEGGFPWFPGGRPDPYITLIVLAGLAEAQHYGVEVPQDMVERALRYLMGEMPKHLKPEEGEVALLLYASYVVTSFPQKLRALPAFMQAGRFAKSWLDYADKHSDAMTQLGKAYAAYAYGKLGDKAKSGLYLDRAMDGSREDPITGVYWQPEKYSWLWYHDTVETHAFLLRALQTLRP
ncbi:MAG: alpha-2-macroglobulin family protein, partial [Elusimicrobiota bacterium]